MKNGFGDNTFSAEKWPAPTMEDPNEIRERLADLNLENRVIRRVKLIGIDYTHIRNRIEDYAYCRLATLDDEEERQRLSNYENIDPDTLYDRMAEIDEPFLIEFEDGDTFEIITPQEEEFRFSMNTIPWGIGAGKNLPNVDPGILFAPCIGKRVKSTELWTNTGRYGPAPAEEHVMTIVLWLEDGTGITIQGWDERCEIRLISEDLDDLSIPFRELKTALFREDRRFVDEEYGLTSKQERRTGIPKPSRFSYLLNKMIQDSRKRKKAQDSGQELSSEDQKAGPGPEAFMYLRVDEDGRSELSTSALGPGDFEDTPENLARDAEYRKQFEAALARVLAEKKMDPQRK